MLCLGLGYPGAPLGAAEPEDRVPAELCLPLGTPSPCHPLHWLRTPLSLQATELLDAILEGYPKSKKQFFVSPKSGLCGAGAVLSSVALSPTVLSPTVLLQEEVGIETDEEHNVVLPAAV